MQSLNLVVVLCAVLLIWEEMPLSRCFLYKEMTTLKVAFAFWFTFADYEKRHSDVAKFNLDMASYGIVQMLSHSGKTYADMTWEPRKAFWAMSQIQ